MPDSVSTNWIIVILKPSLQLRVRTAIPSDPRETPRMGLYKSNVINVVISPAKTYPLNAFSWIIA